MFFLKPANFNMTSWNDMNKYIKKCVSVKNNKNFLNLISKFESKKLISRNKSRPIKSILAWTDLIKMWVGQVSLVLTWNT